MAGGYTHYLFGELQRVNESRVVPGTAGALKAWLDGWLPYWVQSAEEAEPDFEGVRARCREWRTGDWRPRVGVISLPLGDAPEFDSVPYVHLICRVYFSWASGGRVSLTGHAVALTEKQWQALDYNPFRLPHLVKNAGEFDASAPLPFDVFEAGEQVLPDQGADDPDRSWRSQLAVIWQGTPPVRLPANAPPWLYERLLLSLPRERRASTSCVCGPFGLKRSFQQLIDLAPGAELPASDTGPASGGECIEKLDAAKSLDGCWNPSWTSPPLGIPRPALPNEEAPGETQSPTPTYKPEASKKPGASVTVDAKRPVKLGVGIGAALLIGAGLYWGPGLWEGWRLGGDCATWVQDFNRSSTRLNDTRVLLERAETLFARDPDGQGCAGLTDQVRALIDLYRSRLAEIERSPPTSDEDIREIDRLNADLGALRTLPRVLDTDDGKTRYETLLSASDRLYRRTAQWVDAAGKARDLRNRYAFLRDDETAQGLAPNPYLTDIAARVPNFEQQEALDELRMAAGRVEPLDPAGLEKIRKLSEDFRARYPGERGDDLADVLDEAAKRFEKGARPPLQAAFDASQKRPAPDTLTALATAVATYQRDIAPASALSPRVGINTANLLGNLKTGENVKVSVTQTQGPVGERAEIGRLNGLGRCEPQSGFALFANDIVCVQLFHPMAPRPRAPGVPNPVPQPGPIVSDGAGWLKSLFDLLARMLGGHSVGTADLYSVPLQTLVQAGTWRSPDGRVTLRAEVQWPILDAFRR